MGAEMQVFGTLAVLLVVSIALVGVLYLIPIPLWIAAWASNAYVGLLTRGRHAVAPGAARHRGHGADQCGQGRLGCPYR